MINIKKWLESQKETVLLISGTWNISQEDQTTNVDNNSWIKTLVNIKQNKYLFKHINMKSCVQLFCIMNKDVNKSLNKVDRCTR